MSEKSERRGGRREGAGRPEGKTFPAKVTLTMTEQQKEKLLALGGSRWLREKIEASK